jgi:hypothetical protein
LDRSWFARGHGKRSANEVTDEGAAAGKCTLDAANEDLQAGKPTFDASNEDRKRLAWPFAVGFARLHRERCVLDVRFTRRPAQKAFSGVSWAFQSGPRAG